MIIWYISKYASPLRYGFGTRHFYLASEFNRLGHNTIVIAADSNHLVDIPAFKTRYKCENVDGVETWWIRTHKYRGANSLGRILSWLDFEFKLWLLPKQKLPRPDVVIVSSLSLLTVFNGYLLKRKYGCKLIFEVRDIWPLTIVEEGGFKRWNPLVMLLAWTEKFGYRHADVIVGTMPNLAAHVSSVMGKDMNCRCIPFGYDPVMYQNLEPLPEGFSDTYIPQGKFIVGYAGTIGLTNAMETFIECAIAMKDNDRIHFLLLGSGDLLESYKEQTRGLANISFLPKVKKEQVQAVLSQCDLLYFSVKDSLVWSYGLSLNKLVDYMMAAKPIVASYNGYPSMVNEADCGKFIPANDVHALERAITDYAAMTEEERQVIGQRGKDWLTEHRPYAKIAEAYCKILE